MNKILLSSLFLYSSFANAIVAIPTEVLPSAYSFDQIADGQAAGGVYDYFDETGSQLIDGHYGVSPWQTDLGQGNAYQWVGWHSKAQVNIDFKFAQLTQIDGIKIGSVQNNVDDVVLPSIEISKSIDGVNWSAVTTLDVPENSNNDDLYKTFAFDTAFASQYVRVSLKQSHNGPWSFVDEVDFYGSSTPSQVPVPAGIWLFASGLLTAFSLRKELKFLTG